MRGDLAKREPEWVRQWQETQALRAHARGRAGPPEVRAARRPALRQRRHPHRPRGQQDPQGHRGQAQDPGRVRRALRAGLGLPRAAHRAPGREDARQEHSGRTSRSALVPRLRAEQIERQKRDFMRLGVLGDWDHPYLTMDFRDRGRRSSARSGGSCERATCTGARSRSTGASTAARRWRRPRSSTRTAPRRRSTSAFAAVRSCARLARAVRLHAPVRGRRFAVIWTTTPWTLPANQAVRVHPDVHYNLVRTPKRPAGAGRGPARACLQRYGLTGEVLATRHGRGARGTRASATRSTIARCPGRPGRARDAGAGTGWCTPRRRTASTTSSSAAATTSRLDNPVDDNGRFYSWAALRGHGRAGTPNPVIVDTLEQNGRAAARREDHAQLPALLAAQDADHLPRDPQWFIGMDSQPPRRRRARCCARWRRRGDRRTPSSSRLGPRAAGGDDRQPAGLVRLPPAQLGRADGVLRAQGDRRAAPAHRRAHRAGGAAVEEGGIEAWFAAELRGVARRRGARVPEDHRHAGRVVRFGHHACQRAASGRARADASPPTSTSRARDQHRGWFQSSLLAGCAIDGRAPYRRSSPTASSSTAQGRKMSKSLGNVIAPQKVSDTLGAEILRLWVASTDYSGELSISQEILKRVVEMYRRIRNTLRFLLANVSDFDPEAHLLPVGAVDRDRPLRARHGARDAGGVHARTTRATSSTSWRRSCTTSAPRTWARSISTSSRTGSTPARGDSPARRSRAERALPHRRSSLLRLMAPILSFTAEEAWAVLHPRRADDSVFFHTWTDVLPPQDGEAQLREKWKRLREIRAAVVKKLEESRVAGAIGSSLQAEVDDRGAAATTSRLLQSWATTCASCSSPRRRRCRAATAEERHRSTWRRARTPNARAAGTTAPTSARTRLTPAICGRCVANLDGPRRGAAPCLTAPRPAGRAGSLVSAAVVGRWTSPPRRGSRHAFAAGRGARGHGLLHPRAGLQHRRGVQLPRRRRRLAALVLHAGHASRSRRCIVVCCAARTRAAWCLSRLALVLGGALGNLWDRLMLGHVVDFLLVHCGELLLGRRSTSPTRAISVGAALLIWDSVRPHRQRIAGQEKP